MSRKERIQRSFLLLGRERDDYGRPNNEGYPIRAILRDDMLYIWNCKSDRMPAGPGVTGYVDTDASPTKSLILAQHRLGDDLYYQYSFAPRAEEELYLLSKDPYCMNNLALRSDYESVKSDLRSEMLKRLKEQDDPRMFGNGDVFDSYPFMNDAGSRDFYERVVDGSITNPWKRTGWVSPSDYDQYVE